MSQPPLGMASRAFRIRLKKTCWRRFSLPRIGGRPAASSRRTRICEPSSWCSTSESTSSERLVDVDPLELGAAGAREVQQAVDDLGRPEALLLDLLEQLLAGVAVARSGPAAAGCRTRSRRAGVFTSWATPAARRPTEAIFSVCWSCSSRRTRAVTSSRIRIVPQRSPGPAWKGATETLTIRLRPSAAGRCSL